MEKIARGKHDFIMWDLPVILEKSSANMQKNSTFLDVDWHENIEIVYAVKGNGKISCDFMDFPVKEGELFAVNSDVFHGYNSEDSAYDFEYYSLIVDKGFCQANGFDTDTVKLSENIRDNIAVEKFKNVIETFELKGEYRGIAIRAAVLSLIWQLCSHHINKTPETKKKRATNVDNIRSAIVYIRENISKKLNTSELARASGISDYYFIREFKRITGYTPVTYINIVRCDTARKLLYEGELNVGEVAVKCGFDNMPYFTKTFKKYTGMLPSDIKREKKSKA